MKKLGPDTHPRTKEGTAKLHARIRYVGRQMLDRGHSIAAVARRFEMSYQTVHDILVSDPGYNPRKPVR